MSNNLRYNVYYCGIQKMLPYFSNTIDSRLAGWRWSMVSNSRRDCSFIWDINIHPTSTYLSNFMKEEDPYVSQFNKFNRKTRKCQEKLKINIDVSINSILINTKAIAYVKTTKK